MGNNLRQPAGVSRPKRILVLTEGESERIYLNGFRSANASYRRKLSGLVVEQPQNNDPLGLVREAKRKITESRTLPYDSVWVVFDRNGHANIRKAIDEACTYKKIINVAFTSRCFEYWILLHFEQTNKLFKNCDEVKSYLIKRHLKAYEKTCNFYPMVSKFQERALKNAIWLHDRNRPDIENGMSLDSLQAYTSFDKLLQYLIEAVQ